MLSTQQLAQYEHQGYFVMRGLFDATEITELRLAVCAILQELTRDQRSHDVGFDPWSKEGTGDTLNPNRVVYVNDLHLRKPKLEQHMRSAKLTGVFCDLWDEDIKAFQCATVVKPNNYDADYLGWHQDMVDYVPLSNDRNGCAITYLADMGPMSGGTSLVPGSHRSALLERTHSPVPGWPSYLKKRGMQGFTEEGANIVSPQFQAGDVLVFHSSLYHKANSNFTPHSAIGLINVYQAVDCLDLQQRNKFKAADLPITLNRQPLTTTAHHNRSLNEGTCDIHEQAGQICNAFRTQSKALTSSCWDN